MADFNRSKEGDYVFRTYVLTDLGAKEMNGYKNRVAKGDPTTTDLLRAHGHIVLSYAIREALRQQDAKDRLTFPDRQPTTQLRLSTIKRDSIEKNTYWRPGTEGSVTKKP